MASKGGDASILGLKEPFEKRSIHTQTMGRRSASFQTTMNPTLHFPDEGHQKEENLDKDCRVRVAEKTKKSSESRALPRQEPPIATCLTSSLSLQEKTHLKTTTDMPNTVGPETQSTKKALSQQRPRGSEDTTLQYHDVKIVIPADGYDWQRRGRRLSGDGTVRHYFECKSERCHAKRMVRHTLTAPFSYNVTTNGHHNHPIKAPSVSTRENNKRREVKRVQNPARSQVRRVESMSQGAQFTLSRNEAQLLHEAQLLFAGQETV